MSDTRSVSSLHVDFIESRYEELTTKFEGLTQTVNTQKGVEQTLRRSIATQNETIDSLAATNEGLSEELNGLNVRIANLSGQRRTEVALMRDMIALLTVKEADNRKLLQKLDRLRSMPLRDSRRTLSFREAEGRLESLYTALQSLISESEGSTVRHFNRLATMLEGVVKSERSLLIANLTHLTSPTVEPLSLAEELGSNEYAAGLSLVESGSVIEERDQSAYAPTERASSDGGQSDGGSSLRCPSTYASFTDEQGTISSTPDKFPDARAMLGGIPSADDDEILVNRLPIIVPTKPAQVRPAWASLLPLTSWYRAGFSQIEAIISRTSKQAEIRDVGVGATLVTDLSLKHHVHLRPTYDSRMYAISEQTMGALLLALLLSVGSFLLCSLLV